VTDLEQGFSISTRTAIGTPATVHWYTGIVKNQRIKSKNIFLEQMHLHRKIN
jgi:hypothetical protein